MRMQLHPNLKMVYFQVDTKVISRDCQRIPEIFRDNKWKDVSSNEGKISFDSVTPVKNIGKSLWNVSVKFFDYRGCKGCWNEISLNRL